MTGLREELALEQQAILDFQRETDEAWGARQYMRALRAEQHAAQAQARVYELERKLIFEEQQASLTAARDALREAKRTVKEQRREHG